MTHIQPLAVTPYVVGHVAMGSAGTSTTVPVTTVPTLNDTLVAVISVATAGGAVTGVSDSKGNVWTFYASSTASRPLYFGYALNTIALTGSDTISITFGSSVTARITLVGIPGSWRADRTPAGNGGQGTALSAATGTLSVSGEVCIGGCSQSGSTLPTSPSWTLIENFSTATIISSAYTNPAGTTSQTYSLTNSGNPFYDIGVITFQPGQTLSLAGSSAATSSASGSFSAAIVSGSSASSSSATGALTVPSAYVLPGAGSQDYVWVEIIDKNLVSQGPIQFVNLTAQLYYNAVGSWSMTVPYSDFLWNIMMAGDFFVNINWRGLFTFGGKCEVPGYTDSVPGGGGSYSGPFITLAGADYLGLIANRICYPAPASAWSAQTAGATDAQSSVPLETAIKHYVNLNCGPGAISARRISQFTLGTNLARGANVSYTVKFGTGVDLNLMDVIRALIAQAGSGNAMGVQVTRDPSTHGLVFDVYVPRDLSGKAWFSRDLGNLTSIQFSLTDPTCTDALVQGSGTNFIQRTASVVTPFNKTEVFNDSSSETDVNNLTTTAQQAILAGAAGPTLTATLAETPFLTFGRDFGLGDIVTIEVKPGAIYSDVITGVQLTADPSQSPALAVVPTIGQNANATATDQKIIGQLSARIRALEKKLATK